MALCALTFLEPSAGIAQEQLPAAAAECYVSEDAYRQCSLDGFGIPGARDVVLPPGHREIRLWIESGMFLPERVVIIRQADNTVDGQAYYWWPGMAGDDTTYFDFFRPRCGRWYATERAGICEVRTEARPDWAAQLRSLDSLGVSMLPDQRTLPPDGIFTADGFVLYVEVRDHASYRIYRYGNPGSHPDATNQRAARVMGIAQELTRNDLDQSP